MHYLSHDVITAAKEHAREQYPKESCGLVLRISGQDHYWPCTNVAEEPTQDFVISRKEYLAGKGKGELIAILHSHPFEPLSAPAHIGPTEADMAGQVKSAVPWGVLPLDDEVVGDPIMWGDQLPMAPLVGRTFMHGVHDCYALVRDIFRLGAERLLAHDIANWPYQPILLPEVPRDDAWWTKEQDLYKDNFERFGFEVIDMASARPGDVFLTRVNSKVMCHAGVLLDGGLIIHHLPGRLSRREPAGLWGRSSDLWVRYRGAHA